jgi:hypothetical protein
MIDWDYERSRCWFPTPDKPEAPPLDLRMPAMTETRRLRALEQVVRWLENWDDAEERYHAQKPDGTSWAKNPNSVGAMHVRNQIDGAQLSLRAMLPTLSALLSEPQAAPAPQKRPVFGTWPEHCEQRAFVEGAKWWLWRGGSCTMFPTEVDEAEEEAIDRYGQPAASPVVPAPPEDDKP